MAKRTQRAKSNKRAGRRDVKQRSKRDAPARTTDWASFMLLPTDEGDIVMWPLDPTDHNKTLNEYLEEYYISKKPTS